MKHDEHDFGGKLNNSGGDAEADSPIGRELEARVVAAVAGEASAFEAAEVERLAAENPVVAEFKQRMESVHALVAEAAQPDAQPLRLSAERRAKVLAAIGAADSTPKDTPANVVAMQPASKPSLRRRVMPWALAGAAAACLPFVAVFLSRSELAEQKPARPDPSQTVLSQRVVSELTQAPALSVDLPVRSESPYVGAVLPATPQNFAPSPAINGTISAQSPGNIRASGGQTLLGMVGAPGPEVTRKPVDVTFQGAYDSNAVVAAAAPAPAATASQPASDIIKLDAFTVSETREGFAAAMSLSASRQSVALAPPSLPDVLQTNAEIVARDDNRVSAEEQQAKMIGSSDRSILNWGTASSKEPVPFNIATGETFNFTQTVGGAALSRDAQQNSPTAIGRAFTASSVSGDIIDTGLGGVARPNLGTAIGNGTGATNIVASLSEYAGIVTTANLSVGGGGAAPFQLSSDKDTGYAAKASAGAASFNDRREQNRLASERSPQQELAKRRAEEAKIKAEELSIARGGLPAVTAEADKKQLTLMESGTLNLGSASAVSLMVRGDLVGGEKEKTDAPLARAKAPADETLRLETSTATQAVSTFSLHVSDVSFRLAQAALARGDAPDPATIRPEEFYNALNYGDPAPSVAEKVGLKQEQSAHPILAQRNLLRVALKVAATGRTGSTPLRLTVLLDTSGSMEREDRAATVRQAMEVLVSLLGPNDRLTLIGFARQPRLLAENLSGDRAREVLDIIARTPADGGTNMEEALKLATQLALRHRDAKAQNRVVMLTDGAANLGNAVPEQLATRIEELRQRGIAFDACGVGLDGLDDGILEALTRQGDGRYTVLNSPDDAGAGFAQKLAGAFRPAAENVKVQVRFNPARVATYRLIGFEQHRLKEQDFRNDKVDAAELAAEEAGVALYQFEPLAQGEGDVGEVFVRFRDPATGAMVERSWTIPYEPRAAAFDRAAPSLQLAGVAALLAEKLRHDAGAAQITLRDFAPVMSTLQARYRNEPRVQELATMFAQARRLTGQ